MKHLIIIDMQNDFCTGALANPDAIAIIPKIKKYLDAYTGSEVNIIYTRDTHEDNYLDTLEGKYLPVKHCIRYTEGWQIVPELAPTDAVTIIDKGYFGFNGWGMYIKPGDEVTMVGTCTDICVVSNALAIKALGADVTVVADCCAGLTKEKHEAALEVMRSCQCNVI